MAYSQSPPSIPLQQSSFSSLTLEHTLEDLCARFIVNLPAEELESMDRVCFQIEQAHWYYEDFVRPAALNPSLLPSYNLKPFSLLMFRSCPLLHDLIPNHPQIWTSFMAYKERVPVCGAILISEFWDKVLLVKGWQKGASWSFPRGKINKEEAEGMCAIREVLEETGYDLSSEFPPEQLVPGYVEQEGAERRPYYVELVIKEQKIRLYFIPGVHEDTYFETRTRKEISKIDWFKLSDLPTWGKDKKGKKAAAAQAAANAQQKQPKFYMLTPFISHLKLWIDRNKPKDLRKRTNQRVQAPRPVAPTPYHAHTHDGTPHQLPPHLQTDEYAHEGYHPPRFESDADGGRSTSEEEGGETDGETDFEHGEGGVRRPTFSDAKSGTEALNAFFFGGSSAPPQTTSQFSLPVDILRHDSPDLPDPRTAINLANRDEYSAGSTPPQLAYERQSSFAQPRPKATTQHTNTLLALLTNQNPVASPPPPKVTRRQPSNSSAEHIEGPTEGGGLLDIFKTGSRSNLAAYSSANLLTSPSPFGERSTTTVTSNSSLEGGVAPSILFADSAPPIEAEGFGTTHVLTEAERGETEMEEKRTALMRALFSVQSKTPPPAESGLVGTPVRREEGSSAEGMRALFGSGRSSGREQEEEEPRQGRDELGWPNVAPSRQEDVELDGMRRLRIDGEETSFGSPPSQGAWPGSQPALPFPGEVSPLVAATRLQSDGQQVRMMKSANQLGGGGGGSNLLSILNGAGAGPSNGSSNKSSHSQSSPSTYSPQSAQQNLPPPHAHSNGQPTSYLPSPPHPSQPLPFPPQYAPNYPQQQQHPQQIPYPPQHLPPGSLPYPSQPPFGYPSHPQAQPLPFSPFGNAPPGYPTALPTSGPSFLPPPQGFAPAFPPGYYPPPPQFAPPSLPQGMMLPPQQQQQQQQVQQPRVGQGNNSGHLLGLLNGRG